MENEMYSKIYSFENLFIAYIKASKGKSKKDYVVEFGKDIIGNLTKLSNELQSQTYYPKPLVNFIIRDPKVRTISKSAFVDRIVHHAFHIVVEPLFEKCFIYDSYANRIEKGPLKAVDRFQFFLRKVTKNHTKYAFVLKADIKKYFENVNHNILLRILGRRIKDERVLNLAKIILNNFNTANGKGMPLGNLTSQFWANVYLNELDQFVKHKLKAKYYIRYVDDFVILTLNKELLEKYKNKINEFLKNNLLLKLHKEKTKIIPSNRGITFLGIKIFAHHKHIKSQNIKRFNKKVNLIFDEYEKRKIDYDEVYDFLDGWCAFASNANMFNFCNKIVEYKSQRFPKAISSKEVNRLIKYSEPVKIYKSTISLKQAKFAS